MHRVPIEVAGLGLVEVDLPEDVDADDVAVVVQLMSGEVLAYARKGDVGGAQYRVLDSGALHVRPKNGKPVIFGPAAWKSVSGDSTDL